MDRYYILAYRNSNQWNPWMLCWEQHPLELAFHNERLETGDAVIFRFGWIEEDDGGGRGQFCHYPVKKRV